jgi:hypothetical protein
MFASHCSFRLQFFGLTPSREARFLASEVRVSFQFIVLTGVAVEEDDLLRGLVFRLHRARAISRLRQFPSTRSCYLGHEGIQPLQSKLIKLRAPNRWLVFEEQALPVDQLPRERDRIGCPIPSTRIVEPLRMLGRSLVDFDQYRHLPLADNAPAQIP